jgi:hypothetical protein
LVPEAVTLGNFSGRGAEPARRLKDVEPFGTSGMAGNVKEWVWNAVGEARYILGGGWSEPVYMAVMDEARPPLDRGEMNGFRCIKETTRSDAGVYAASAPTTFRDLSKDKPVDDATFEILRRFYSYDRTPLDSRVEAVHEDERWRRERVSFAAAYGDERVLADILIPKNVMPPYQAVIWFPGVYAFGLKHSDGDLSFSYDFDFLPKNGRALVYPVFKGTHERSTRLELTKQLREGAVQWSKDLGRTIDYLNAGAISIRTGSPSTASASAPHTRFQPSPSNHACTPPSCFPAVCPMKCYPRKRHRSTSSRE